MATGYSLTTHYAGQGLLDSFSFFTGNDPSHGFVDYQSKEEALAKNLVSVESDYNSVRLGVDSNNTYSSSDKGRPSVRLTSDDAFTHGLFIADIYHMPASTCGTWPSFWAFNNQENGAEWPSGGELDIIDGANTAQRNLYSAHTTTGCKSPSAGFTGKQGRANCSPTLDNTGCDTVSPPSDTTSYGDAFNAEGGGVYALEWDSEDLKLWHFPRSTIPDNIVYAHVLGPDPSTWGPPQAVFGGSSCSPDEYFFNMSLVLNINFCGDYAGKIWGKTDQCNRLAPTCEEFVAGNPDSFQNAYWDINFIDVYQMGPLSDLTIPPLSINATSTSISSAPSEIETTTSVVPTHTRTITLSTVKPTETGGVSTHPRDINGHTLLGCFQPHATYESFSQVRSSADMDSKACVSACAGHKYAGVQGDTCYCADTLEEASGVENEQCNTPCPGNGHEVCGGLVNPASTQGPPSHSLPTNSSASAPQPHHHTSLDNILLTVYGNLSNEPAPPAAPAMGGRYDDHDHDYHPSVKPAHNAPVTTDVTITYTTVCASNPAKLVEVEYHTTVTYAQCTCTSTKSQPEPAYPTTTNVPPPPPAAALAAIPMKMYKATCHACGPHGESTVTLTVPNAVYTSSQAVVTATAVQTVIPLVSNGTGTGLANGTAAAVAMATLTPPPPPSPRPTSNNVKPLVAAAAPRSETLSAAQIVGWGVAAWFGLFGIMLVL
ncbi:glycoside hydrolase family 16 protein [Daldinia vernicosa]|uniref:glycoside hydrolase family 16 protein n=1 Tax=Daldinia vernicosa TaxID=114800 RepID=UPI002007CD39|nr:glycoside hydrolase family 16 protein [Daldinia vernicosa]KAI0852586.1 glycoside hydrolase family 16 protein [Daldinia vernicosa]